MSYVHVGSKNTVRNVIGPRGHVTLQVRENESTMDGRSVSALCRDCCYVFTVSLVHSAMDVSCIGLRCFGCEMCPDISLRLTGSFSCQMEENLWSVQGIRGDKVVHEHRILRGAGYSDPVVRW